MDLHNEFLSLLEIGARSDDENEEEEGAQDAEVAATN